MIIFWILAAGLMALAVLFVVPPLLRVHQANPSPSQDNLNLQVFRRRMEELDADLAAGFLDQAQYDSARRDLERELLSDLGDNPQATASRPEARSRDGSAPILALILAILLPTAAVFAYLELGNGGIIPSLEAAAGGAAPGMEGADAGAMASLETLAQGLADRLAKDPDNLDGWLMLGRTYFAVNQPVKALDALEHAYTLGPRKPEALVAYAEALAANAGNRLAGRPTELIRTALEIEPDNVSALWLSGMVDYQKGQFSDAITTWEGVLAGLDPAGDEAVQMRQMIAEARSRAGPPAATDASPIARPDEAIASLPPSAPQPTPAMPQAAIRVNVRLSPNLAAAAAPSDTLFVFARAPSGPPMPLAVQRLTVSDLPTTVTLDDSMAMMPTMRLSAFPEVLVGARISKSGQASPSSGDLEGQTGPVAVPGAPEVAVTIDTQRP